MLKLMFNHLVRQVKHAYNISLFVSGKVNSMTTCMNKKLQALKERNALNQVQISVLLMAIIPGLSLFYLGTVITTQNSPFSAFNILLICFLTLAVAAPGFLILQKYPKNIIKLRRYITEIAEGALPEKIELEETQNSDDIQYIENNFNSILETMRERIAKAEKQLEVECALRKKIEQQQGKLLEAERQRVMIQTLGAACHHIGQPATVLQMQMDLLMSHVTDADKIEEIRDCAEEVNKISDILQQLQRTSTFKSIPYIDDEGPLNEQIIAINNDIESKMA